MHGFLGSHGVPPLELRRRAREELAPYTNVKLIDARVVDARRTAEGFEVIDERGGRVRARKLLIATGVNF